MDLQSPIFKQGYGMIPKIPMRDARLSAEAKAIYAYLCAFAGHDGEAYPSAEIMCKELGISAHRFFKHRKQLEELGYISMQRPRQDKRYGQTVYTLNGDPAGAQTVCVQNQHVQNQHVEIQHVENQHVQNLHVGNEHVENQHVEIQHVENEHDINNRYTSNSLTSNSQISNSLTNIPPTPQGGQDAQVEEAQPVKAEPVRKPKKTRTKKGHAVNEQGKSIPGAKYRPEDFERWWAKYPEHTDREGAVTKWETAIEQNALPCIEILLGALEWQIPLNNWRARRNDDPMPNYTLNPARYLERRRWQDEKPAPQPQPMNGYPRFQQTGKLQGEALHEHNMEVARIVLAQRAQARAEGKPASPLAALTN